GGASCRSCRHPPPTTRPCGRRAGIRLGARSTRFPKRRSREALLPSITSRALRRDPEILVLMQDLVERILVVLGDTKDADHSVLQIAIVVEGDFALDRLDMASLHGVPHRLAGDLSAGGRHSLYRIENDQRRIVGGDRIVLWLLSKFFGKAGDHRRGL